MNPSFSLHRFGQLFKRELSLSNAKIFKPTLVALGLYLLFWVSTDSIFGNIEEINILRGIVFSSLLVLFILLMPLILYKNFNDKRKGLIDAMLPVSSLEKFLVKWLICTLIYPIIALVLFLSVDILVAWIFNYIPVVNLIDLIKDPKALKSFATSFSPVKLKSLLDSSIITMGFIIMMTQSTFLLGTHFFKSHQFSKTILTNMSLYIILYIIFRSLIVPSIESINISGQHTSYPEYLSFDGFLIIHTVISLLILWFLTFRVIKTHKFY